MVYNIVLISAISQHESAIDIYTTMDFPDGSVGKNLPAVQKMQD